MRIEGRQQWVQDDGQASVVVLRRRGLQRHAGMLHLLPVSPGCAACTYFQSAPGAPRATDARRSPSRCPLTAHRAACVPLHERAQVAGQSRLLSVARGGGSLAASQPRVAGVGAVSYTNRRTQVHHSRAQITPQVAAPKCILASSRKCLSIFYWVLGLHKMIFGGKGHVSSFPPRVLHGL